MSNEKQESLADRLEAATKREKAQPGNAAAMREALEAARDLLLPQCNGGTAFAKTCGETVNKIMDALSAPPRNCDVGTAEEQEERYIKLKREHIDKLTRCPAVGPSFFPDSLYWAQIPYKEKEGAE